MRAMLFRREPDMPQEHRVHGALLQDARTRPAGQSARPRSSSLTLVLLRVFSSTCLTITAQYSECEPSAAGSEPDTTTLPGGT